MKISAKGIISAVLLGMLSLASIPVDARTRDTKKSKQQDEILRASKGPFDQQQNKVSNIQFFTTNYGVFGNNGQTGGGYWPRGGQNQYIYGGGIWFGALKNVQKETGETVVEKLSVISYDPNSGVSWFAPGRISDGPNLVDDLQKKHRVYFSTDFTSSGTPNILSDGPNWPIWDTQPYPDTLRVDRYFGNYVDDESLRNNTTYPKGPAYISQEDIFSAYKDTDLSRYSGLGTTVAREKGFPMGLQVEQTIYSWGFGDYRDFIFLKYFIINTSPDTLRECYMASANDMDIARQNNAQAGAANDHVSFYVEDPSLNLAYQWSEGNQQESGNGFGYIGFDFLESPAVDANKNIRRDKKFYDNSEQLGLHTFRNWVIEIDPSTVEQRYDFMAGGQKDIDDGAGDKRFLMSTGPFNLAQGDTARIVVGLIMAKAGTENGSKTSPTGTPEDLVELIRKDKFAQFVYDNNFKAPKPPDVPRMTWEPINNGVIVHWDSTAELSFDDLEAGLDFLGYRLYRARNKDLDSFNIDYINAQSRTPEGWKEIAMWQLPYPFIKSTEKATAEQDSPFFDQIYLLNQSSDNLTFNIMRFGTGMQPFFQYNAQANSVTPLLDSIKIDRTNEPWGEFYGNANLQQIIDTVLTGRVVIDISAKAEVADVKNISSPTESATAIANIYRLVRENKAKIIFPEFEDKLFVRNSIIVPYMKKLTNNRTFVDVGDDDKSGIVTESNDVATTEKLVNGLDYYYRLLAYDEGDYRQPTPGKYSASVTESNVIRATPLAARAGNDVTITLVDSTADLLGGISNFRFIVKDQDRVRQLYGGHTLEVEFIPSIFASAYLADAGTATGIYSSNIIFRDVTTGQVLANYDDVLYQPTQCGPVIGTFSENSGVFVGCDTCDESTPTPKPLGLPNSTLDSARSGFFSSDVSCNAPNQYIANALGFAFDYTFIQYGGLYRAFSARVTKGDVTEGVAQISTVPAQLTQLVGTEFVNFNEGPAKYIVDFSEGGVETLTLKYGTPPQDKDFVVPYLTVKVTKDSRDTLPSGRTIGGPREVSHINLEHRPAANFIDVRDVPLSSFNLAAYGWVNGDWDSTSTERLDNNKTIPARRDQSTQPATGKVNPVGTQGRYYLTGTAADGSTVKFTHTFYGSGLVFGMDFANKHGRRGPETGLFKRRGLMPANDFKAGDQVMFESFGGASGLPKAGAKYQFKVSEDVALVDYTDELLNQVQVVPNPYYVTHAGQSSQYDAKVYFTNLPTECTISIYTINGDLIRTIEHNESTLPESSRTFRTGTDFWDLVSDNNQQSASQVLIAKIETPNGASSIVKFSIITGGFRQVPE